MSKARELSRLCESNVLDLVGWEFETEHEVDADPETGDAKITVTGLTLDYADAISADPDWEAYLNSFKDGDKVKLDSRVKLDKRNVIDLKGTYPIKKISISDEGMKIGVEIEIRQKWES